MTDCITCMKLRIDWSEVDSFGHVNNLAILRYAQTARIHYMEQIGMMKFHEEQNIGPVLASTHCQFRKQLYYPGQITIRSVVDHIKTTSFQMHPTITNEQGDCIAETRDVLVMFDYKRNVKHAIPELFRKQMGFGQGEQGT